MYKEYKLATILNVITGINALSSWYEVKSLLEYLNGEKFPEYKVMSVLNSVRSKILIKNRQFIELDVIMFKAGYLNAKDQQLFLKNWLDQQEMIFGKSFKVYFDGRLEEISNELKNVDSQEQSSFQKIKRPNFAKITV